MQLTIIKMNYQETLACRDCHPERSEGSAN